MCCVFECQETGVLVGNRGVCDPVVRRLFPCCLPPHRHNIGGTDLHGKNSRKLSVFIHRDPCFIHKTKLWWDNCEKVLQRTAMSHGKVLDYQIDLLSPRKWQCTERFGELL